MRRSDLSGSSSRHPHQRIVQDHANRLLTLLEQEHHRKRMALEPNRAVQTGQLQVISGSLDLIVLQDRCLHWIHLRDDESMWLRIPPGGIPWRRQPQCTAGCGGECGAASRRQ